MVRRKMTHEPPNKLKMLLHGCSLCCCPLLRAAKCTPLCCASDMQMSCRGVCSGQWTSKSGADYLH
jgi:hypothetical protein